MPEENCPSRIHWLLIGMALGLVSYPFYAVLLGADDPKRLRGARAR